LAKGPVGNMANQTLKPLYSQ